MELNGNRLDDDDDEEDTELELEVELSFISTSVCVWLKLCREKEEEEEKEANAGPGGLGPKAVEEEAEEMALECRTGGRETIGFGISITKLIKTIQK